jgi:hypothetical protein
VTRPRHSVVAGMAGIHFRAKATTRLEGPGHGSEARFSVLIGQQQRIRWIAYEFPRIDAQMSTWRKITGHVVSEELGGQRRDSILFSIASVLRRCVNARLRQPGRPIREPLHLGLLHATREPLAAAEYHYGLSGETGRDWPYKRVLRPTNATDLKGNLSGTPFGEYATRGSRVTVSPSSPQISAMLHDV